MEIMVLRAPDGPGSIGTKISRILRKVVITSSCDQTIPTFRILGGEDEDIKKLVAAGFKIVWIPFCPICSKELIAS